MTTDTTKTVLAGSEQPEQPASLAAGAQASRPSGSGKPETGKKPAVNAKRTRERLVIVSMGLVTAASAATLYAVLGFSVSSAVLCGGMIWAALMTLHVQIKKNAEIAHLKAELARLEAAGGAGLPSGVSAGAAGNAPAIGQPHGDAERPAAAPTRARPPARRPSVTAPLSAADGRMAQGTAADLHHQPSLPDPASGSIAGPQPQPRWEMTADQSRAARRPSVVSSSPAPSSSAGARGPGHAAGEPRANPALETALWPGTSLSVADPMRDQWAFRPKDATLVAAQPAPSNNNDQSAGHGQSPAGPANSIDSDLEMVQRKIKALADEVNAAEQNRDRQPSSVQQPSELDKSIGALKATAETMRDRPQNTGKPVRERRIQPASAMPAAPVSVKPAAEPSMQDQTLPFELMIPATAERIAVSDPAASSSPSPELHHDELSHPEPAQLPVLELPPLPVFEFAAVPEAKPNPRLAAIIAAVENGEMDVFLSPIVALQSHQVSHYDVTVRLKSQTGAYLDDAEQELQLAGSDVLALFDTARLRRSAALAQRLDAHNKSGSLLSAVNGPSITNAEFLETFARVYEERDRISNQLVLTFAQADLEQFSPSAWQALSDMHAFGFRFALAKVDHVEMDFAALAARGFAFLRLEADALTNGLPARDRFVGVDELCKLLAGAGMTLVADTIDDEAIRARVFGFGVLFGQGRLFGGARHVKLDTLPAGSSAAA